MAGNVWEWVDGVFDASSIGYPADSTGPASGDLRVLRGGSWGYCPAFLRASYRYAVAPEADYLAVGFRCAVSSTD
jgi:formylglycine-generating enzyme required for sulfatase activity